MMSDLKSPGSAQRLSDLIEVRERRRLQADRHRRQDPHHQSIWQGFATFGRIGWSIAVPTLIGTAFGAWVDSLAMDTHSWTLICLLAGLSIGCFNACHWLMSEHRGLLKAGEQPSPEHREPGQDHRGDAP